VIFAAWTSQPVLTAMALRLEEPQSHMSRDEIGLGQALTMTVKYAGEPSNTSEEDAGGQEVSGQGNGVMAASVGHDSQRLWLSSRTCRLKGAPR
jgi:hypothetical protein